MAIVGGFDIHRRQVTFDYLDTVTGQVRGGRIDPACRAALRHRLERFAGRGDVTFAVEGCTGWRFVVEEQLQRAGISALLAESAETAHRRGPKKRAKTDKADSRHLRMLVADGRVPNRTTRPPIHIATAPYGCMTRLLCRCAGIARTVAQPALEVEVKTGGRVPEPTRSGCSPTAGDHLPACRLRFRPTDHP